jgi:DNA primase
MPALDYRQAHRDVRLTEVLDLVGFEPTTRHGAQWRGPCPVHRSHTEASRSFAAHVDKGVWHCFRCRTGGNALDLWMAVTRQPLHAAVLDLYARLGREAPWLRRPREQDKRTMPKL